MEREERRKQIKQLQAIPFALIFFGLVVLIEYKHEWWWIPTFLGVFGMAGLRSWLFTLKDH
jgi:uncharacterized membrane protein (DUF485 family)